MRVVYLGTPAAAVPPLRALLDSAHQVVAVVTRPDRPRDRRGGAPLPSPVKQAALAAGVPVLEPPGGRDPELPGRLAATGADIGVACAFGYLLPDQVLAALPRGIVNLHFSLLPAYRGAAPVQRALLDGVEVTGVTTFVIDAGMDTGPMLLAAEVPVEPGEDAGSLTARLAEVGARLTVETLDALEAGQVELIASATDKDGRDSRASVTARMKTPTPFSGSSRAASWRSSPPPTGCRAKR